MYRDKPIKKKIFLAVNKLEIIKVNRFVVFKIHKKNSPINVKKYLVMTGQD